LILGLPTKSLTPLVKNLLPETELANQKAMEY